MGMGQVYWGTQGALANQSVPKILMLGDSWFWYPLDNLAIEIQAAFPDDDFLVIGKNGAEAAEWNTRLVKDVDAAFKFYASSVQALMLSGGGNDIAGTNDFLRILADNCAKAETVQDCYRTAQPEVILSGITAACRQVIMKFRAYNPQAPVLLHNYDHAWPSGKGVFGPADWLKAPMEKAKVPRALRRDLFKDLIAKLHDSQLTLSQDAQLGPIVAIACAGTLPNDADTKDRWWANELHPTPKGFKRLAQAAFVPALKTALKA